MAIFIAFRGFCLNKLQQLFSDSGLSGLDYGILAAGLLMMVLVSLVQRTGSVREKIAARPYLRFPTASPKWALANLENFSMGLQTEMG